MNKNSFLQLDISSPEEIQKISEYSRKKGTIVGNIQKDLTSYDLFSQQIFGPKISYTCACGKEVTFLKKENVFNQFCPKCGVEFISKNLRLSRKGFIKLNYSVIHPFYLDYCTKFILTTNEGMQNILKINTFKMLPTFFFMDTFFIRVFNFFYI